MLRVIIEDKSFWKEIVNNSNKSYDNLIKDKYKFWSIVTKEYIMRGGIIKHNLSNMESYVILNDSEVFIYNSLKDMITNEMLLGILCGIVYIYYKGDPYINNIKLIE